MNVEWHAAMSPCLRMKLREQAGKSLPFCSIRRAKGFQ